MQKVDVKGSVAECQWCKKPIKSGQKYNLEKGIGWVHSLLKDCGPRKLKGEISIGEGDPEIELDDERYKKDIELEERKILVLENILISLKNINNVLWEIATRLIK